MYEKITNETDKQKYDHEPTPTQKKFLESVDMFLELKPKASRLTFVDLACVQPAEEAKSIIEASQLGRVLAGNDDQLAMESDGSYHPILDIKKSTSTFTGMSVRAWGWEDQKMRYVCDENDDVKGYIVYDGEKDRTRQLDINFHYQQAEEAFVETVSLYGSTCWSQNPQLQRSLYMSAYAETGYEGHGSESIGIASDETVEEFIAIAERLTGAVTD